MIKLYQLQDDRLTRILLTTADRIFGIKRPVACLAISVILTIMLFLTTFPAERGNILLIFSCLVVVLFSVIAIGNIKTLPAVKSSIVRNKGKIIEITFDKANKLAVCGQVFCPEMTISQFWLEDYYIIFFKSDLNVFMVLCLINEDSFEDILCIAKYLNSKGRRLIRLNPKKKYSFYMNR